MSSKMKEILERVDEKKDYIKITTSRKEIMWNVRDGKVISPDGDIKLKEIVGVWKKLFNKKYGKLIGAVYITDKKI